MSRALLRTALLLAAVGASLAVPSIASAASATLTSPPDGATYYTGDSFPWQAQVPTSASFNRDPGCMGTTVGGVERRALPSGGFASEGGTLGGTFTKAFRDSLGKFGHLVQRENDVVPVIEYTERFAQRTGWATGGVGLAAPPPLKPAFKLVASLYDSEYKLAKYIQFRHEQDHKSHVIQLGGFVTSYNETCKGVKAAARSSFAAWPAPPLASSSDARAASLPGTPVTAAEATRLGGLLSKLRRHRQERTYDLQEARGRDEHAPQPPHE